ncbi:MAG: hypothetical protein RRA94_03050 [Bacteroidota bacterium]|nr:hypothetical protein [Bacteroidota bacterium]
MTIHRYMRSFIQFLLAVMVLSASAGISGTHSHPGSITFHLPALPAAVEGDSLEFPGFSRALEKIFSPEKIQTILSKLPANCKIYGFDVGDYSGDDGMDVVLSTRAENARSREMQVHFFVNDGAGFRRVQVLERHFVLEPIEVGFSIERGRALVTEKTGDFGWRMTGYAVRDHVFQRVDEWGTDRMSYRGRETGVAWERTRDYRTQLIDEHFFGANTKRSFLRHRYYDLPVFPDGVELPKPLPAEVGDESALMIVRGGSSWHGPEDCSISVSGRYDSAEVVLALRVHDDRLLYNTDADSSDYAALYFDLSRNTRLRPGGSAQQYSPNTQFGLVLLMGDGEAHGPVVELRGAKLAGEHGAAISVDMQRIPVAFQQFLFTIRLPRALFADGASLPPAGFAAVYHDVDYPAHLHWVSVASTARGYEEKRPETYGKLHFVRDFRAEWEWDNLATRDLTRQLKEAGVLP